MARDRDEAGAFTDRVVLVGAGGDHEVACSVGEPDQPDPNCPAAAAESWVPWHSPYASKAALIFLSSAPVGALAASATGRGGE